MNFQTHRGGYHISYRQLESTFRTRKATFIAVRVKGEEMLILRLWMMVKQRKKDILESYPIFSLLQAETEKPVEKTCEVFIAHCSTEWENMVHVTQEEDAHAFGISECEGKYSHRIDSFTPEPDLLIRDVHVCVVCRCFHVPCVCVFLSDVPCLHCICYWRLLHNNDLMSRRAEPEWINVHASQWSCEWKSEVKVRENEEKLTRRSLVLPLLGMRRREEHDSIGSLFSISSRTSELIEFCRRGKERQK